ncbi:MAG: 4Fe-4S dicluster domain-containing protein [Deltaproteobacteria bacterium]|nr:4Fe-4S dicluster domain-containing protein [Deltaproteobacteria bacterium]
MAVDRREFLKIAGASAVLALGGKEVVDILVPGEVEASMKDLPIGQEKRWAMVVDTTKMDDNLIKRCQEVCHHIHNVPDLDSPKEEIKWIWEDDYEHTFPEQENEYVAEKIEKRVFPLLCNQCTNPPCCRVCPTQATWQREDGIVLIDEHRCIGCRFCMAACPYGSRSFNWGDPRRVMEDDQLKKLNPDFPANPDYPTRTKGVVEKCTFCEERLAEGKLPACVETANKIKKGALIFGDLADPQSEVRKVLRERYSIRRKPELGTGPNVYYII